MKRQIDFIMALGAFLSIILGCGGLKTGPQEWLQAKPLTERLDHPNALANDGEFIYFITGGTVASQHEGTNNVMKMPLAGGTPTILFKGGDIIPDADAIALDDKFVYFSANGLRRVPKQGGEASLLTKAFIASEIVVDQENVYWMPFVGEGMPPAPIYTVSKNGGEPKNLTGARNSANGLCVDDNFIYWAQTDGLYRAAKPGGNVEKIYSTPSGEIASDLRADKDAFYFLQGPSKRALYKLARSGGAAQRLAPEVSKFWLGATEIVFQRYVSSFDIAIYKIGKGGQGETELDKDGYLADLTVGPDKVYLSDIVKIYGLEKKPN